MIKIQEYMRELGKKGGKSRALRLSSERRIEIAQIASRERWAKKTDDFSLLTK